jgi:carbamoyltransferase
MIIIGINFSHDSSVTLIRDGKIIAAIEEEKTSRIKQQFGWPHSALECLLEQFKLEKSQVDLIAFGSFFYNELPKHETIYRFTRNKKYKQKEIASRIFGYFGLSTIKLGTNNIEVYKTQVKDLGYINANVTFYNHHLSHAASAHYCSPFKPDLTITCDGHGDGESFNFYTFDNAMGLTLIKSNSHKVSVGQFYSAITQLLGFRPTRHEGKITGLAAYGKHTSMVDDFMDFFVYDSKNNLTRYPFDKDDQLWKEFKIESTLSLKDKINQKTSESPIGVDYAKRSKILLERIKQLSKGFSKEDIAFACQNVAEQVVVNEIKNVIENFGLNSRPITIALAGGVFANVRINQKICELPQVSNIFVQPAMGDSGLSMGAAIIADIKFNNRDLNTTQYQFANTYIGPDFTNDIQSFLETIANNSEIKLMENPAMEIAQMLKDNKVIGFWHGSMEWGPRALGKRSMIINTFDKTVNDSVNKRLNRTEFMPFAPSIIDYMMKTYIPKYKENCPAAEYMTITYDVDPKYHKELEAVVHVDGTARPQSVSKETNPYYYAIIDEFYKLTGCGAIVNTSFNVHEEPIVSTPQSAYKALVDNRIDILIIENYKVTMKY